MMEISRVVIGLAMEQQQASLPRDRDIDLVGQLDPPAPSKCFHEYLGVAEQLRLMAEERRENREIALESPARRGAGTRRRARRRDLNRSNTML
jgi:hypothetical protein